MTPTDIRATVALIAPYTVIIAAMAFAKWGVDATIISLVAGGCLAAIDPRRGQSQATTVTTSDPATQTTVQTGETTKAVDAPEIKP